MFSRKPDLQNLNQMSREINSLPLPNIPENPHILLPPPEHSLVRNNFQVFSEELFNMLNNPNSEIEKNLDDLDFNPQNNRGKSRKSIIGIKRHHERNNERISLGSNLKKRKLENEENFENSSINASKILKEKDNLQNKNNLNNKNKNIHLNSIGGGKNNKINDNRSENQENLNDEDNNDEGEEGDFEDQIEHQSENSEEHFNDLREDFNSDMGDYL